MIRMFKENRKRLGRDGSAVESVRCSCRGTEFRSLNPCQAVHNRIKLQIKRDLTLLASENIHTPVHILIHTYTQLTNKYLKIKHSTYVYQKWCHFHLLFSSPILVPLLLISVFPTRSLLLPCLTHVCHTTFSQHLI